MPRPGPGPFDVAVARGSWELLVVLDLSVLLRCLGGNSVMDAPLRRLVEVSQLPSVTLRVFR